MRHRFQIEKPSPSQPPVPPPALQVWHLSIVLCIIKEQNNILHLIHILENKEFTVSSLHVFFFQKAGAKCHQIGALKAALRSKGLYLMFV